jgi:hypothetical protein
MADPNDPDKLTSLGIIYGEDGAYREVVPPLEKAAHLDPDLMCVFPLASLPFETYQSA